MATVHPREQELQGVEFTVHMQLRQMQSHAGLTDLEMVQILNNYIGVFVTRFIRQERS
jgi:hypothetical protein